MGVPAQQGPGEDLVPVWGRKLTVPCTHCTLATQRHRTLDFDGVNIYRSQAGPDPARVVEGEDPSLERVWIALMPGDCPARLFADTELYHLVGGIAWPGPHHRDYGNAKVDHNARLEGSETCARRPGLRLVHRNLPIPAMAGHKVRETAAPPPVTT